ncbi:MAG TPA: sigma-70 family RNA polymerase sigma factor [Solirubrobacter sp.]|nr:sigma-70 family RNA polymerase sigma factor [Solirubrobacter sp.]
MDVDALYAHHREALLLFLARRTADPEIALDLWAETFAQAVAGAKRFRGSSDGEAAGWLYRIARRQLALYYRRGKIEQRALARLKLERPPASPELLADIERRAGLSELRAELDDALARLSPGVRDAVRLRIVDERPYPELARDLGITEQAARVRVSRGLATLAELLDAAAIHRARTT